jgi:hypothetical protein
MLFSEPVLLLCYLLTPLYRAFTIIYLKQPNLCRVYHVPSVEYLQSLLYEMLFRT